MREKEGEKKPTGTADFINHFASGNMPVAFFVVMRLFT